MGKTLAAEVVGFETGKPLKVINCAELVSKYVGETGKNIEMIFKEARTLDCILVRIHVFQLVKFTHFPFCPLKVFDEAESLFGARSTSQVTSTDRYANMDTGILLYHVPTHLLSIHTLANDLTLTDGEIPWHCGMITTPVSLPLAISQFNVILQPS